MTDIEFQRRPYAHIFTGRDLIDLSNRLGSYFFTLDSMRFWGSRVSKKVRVAESNAQRPILEGHPEQEPQEIHTLFITSEKDAAYQWNSGRRYTLRVARIFPMRYGDRIDFGTIGEFGLYPTLRSAQKALKELPLSEWSNPFLFHEIDTRLN